MIENMSVFVRRFFVEFDRCEALLSLSLAAEYCEPPPPQRFGPFLNWLLSKQEDAKSLFFLQNQARTIQTHKTVFENSFLAMFISQVSSKLRDKHCQITRISILILNNVLWVST